ncbi:hypothetical protein [Phyllobacterium brassicacearum]|nr:hypothetical protein [Phyllobacterium brassicacearum]
MDAQAPAWEGRGYLERDKFILKLFRFPDGETFHKEGGKADVVPSDEAA